MADWKIVVDAIPALRRIVADEFLSQAAAAIERRGRFVVALPGGSVASAFFPALADLRLDWDRLDIFWLDERAVPPGDPESNYGLASRLLLEPARVPPERVHRLRGEFPDLDEAARLGADELTRVAGNPPALDLALVGFGDDGHIASIFPGAPPDVGGAELSNGGAELSNGGAGLQPCHPLVAAVLDAPKPPPRRLTMTLPVIAHAGLVVAAGFGAAKARAVREAIDPAAPATPLGELLRRARAPLVLVDSPYSH